MLQVYQVKYKQIPFKQDIKTPFALGVYLHKPNNDWAGYKYNIDRYHYSGYTLQQSNIIICLSNQTCIQHTNKPTTTNQWQKLSNSYILYQTIN